MGDLAGMAVGVGDDPGVATPEGLARLAPDPRAGGARLLDGLVDLLARAEVDRERHPAPPGRVLDAAVLREPGPLPDPPHHPPSLEEDHVAPRLSPGNPPQRLVELPRSTEIGHAQSDQVDPLLHNPNCLPRISFMSPEHGTAGHAGSSEGKDSPQMSLFRGESDDRG